MKRWKGENVKMWKYENVKIWNVKMWESETVRMWEYANVKMLKSEKVKIWKCYIFLYHALSGEYYFAALAHFVLVGEISPKVPPGQIKMKSWKFYMKVSYFLKTRPEVYSSTPLVWIWGTRQTRPTRLTRGVCEWVRDPPTVPLRCYRLTLRTVLIVKWTAYFR